MTHLLEFRNVTKTYTRGYFSDAGTTALQDFSMVLDEDSPTIMTVAGESGSGKTTIAMMVVRASVPVRISKTAQEGGQPQSVPVQFVV